MAETTLRAGIVGDYDGRISHLATDEALQHTARALGIAIEAVWLPTEPLASTGAAAELLAGFDCLLVAPGSPYRSERGAVAAIEFARTHDIPFLGTCGGCQHALLEYARNVLGIVDAGHAENDPQAANPLIVEVACAVEGEPGDGPRLNGSFEVLIKPNTLVHRIMQSDRSIEIFTCSFALDPRFRARLEAGGMCISAADAGGELRAAELPDQRFYLSTLFQPQRSSTPRHPHPILTAYLQAALRYRQERGLGTRSEPALS